MNRTAIHQLQIATAAVLAAATAVEAFRIDELLLAALSLVAAATCVAILLTARRPTFEIRSDLAAWVRTTAAANGESDGRIVDRAVGRLRDAIDGVAAGVDGGSGSS